jgi:hypothetical protein
MRTSTFAFSPPPGYAEPLTGPETVGSRLSRLQTGKKGGPVCEFASSKTPTLRISIL